MNNPESLNDREYPHNTSPINATMVDYGMAEPQVTDLKTSFDNFLVLNGQPRQYRISSKVATESLKELFSSSSELLDK